MKKVGIITVHRLPNWGSTLQAYALQRVINGLGFETENIDYRYPNEFHWERGKNWGRKPPLILKSVALSIKNKIMYTLHLKARPQMQLLNKFINSNMKLSRKYSSFDELHKNPPIYDIYVSGSDQIWNPNTMLGDTSYMLDFASDSAKKIAYASSFSCRNIPEDKVSIYKKYLNRYYALSVRENNGKTIIHELLGREADIVLDPTLLLSREDWHDLSMKARKVKLPSKYILCYMLAYTFSADEPMNILLQRIQKKYSWPIIVLKNVPRGFSGQLSELPRNYDIGVPEFLYLIQHATLVVSSSFHGVAFALNFGRPLVALAKEDEDDRITSLINNLGISNEVLVMTSEVKLKEITPFYNVEKEQMALKRMREASIEYLAKKLN